MPGPCILSSLQVRLGKRLSFLLKLFGTAEGGINCAAGVESFVDVNARSRDVVVVCDMYCVEALSFYWFGIQ